MEVFVVPIGGDHYELYCEPSHDALADAGTDVRSGRFSRLRDRFAVMVRDAEAPRHRTSVDDERSWAARTQHRILAWVSERIAEQRLLWALRRETSVVAIHPADMTFERVRTLIDRVLQRDRQRHRRWLVIDGVLAVASAALALLPGPNVVFYYFAFRVVGHWLSMRGAEQGLRRVTWSGRSSDVLTELRDVQVLDASARDARIDDIAARLELPHLSAFYARVM